MDSHLITYAASSTDYWYADIPMPADLVAEHERILSGEDVYEPDIPIPRIRTPHDARLSRERAALRKRLAQRRMMRNVREVSAQHLRRCSRPRMPRRRRGSAALARGAPSDGDPEPGSARLGHQHRGAR